MGLESSDEREGWSIRRLMLWTRDHLTGKDVDDARLATEVLLAHALQCRRVDLYARIDDVPDETQLVRFREAVRRAASHEPVAYIVGEREFFSLTFVVTTDVLIPRPETESVVEAVVDHCATAELKQPHILDVGTGSGCIAVALLKQIPGATAVATDVSPPAIAIARANAERHGVAERMTLAEADRLSLPAELIPEGGFDILVSNPPYVAASEMAGLDATVREYEPHIALTDEGDGLSFYASIGAGAPAILSAGGMVVLEIGDGQARAAREAVERSGGLAHTTTIKDRVTAKDRVLVFRVL